MKTQADHARAYRQRKAAKLERLARLEGALREIAACDSHHPGDVVSIARQALGDVG